MNIEIKEKATQPMYLNAFVVECEAMYGDADGGKTVEVGGFVKGQDEDLLEQFLQVCERMKNAYPNGRGGGGTDEYDHIDGFYEWFSDSILPDKPPIPERIENLHGEWVNDPMTDYQCQATFSDYEVFYYDENGVKYHVEVTL